MTGMKISVTWISIKKRKDKRTIKNNNNNVETFLDKQLTAAGKPHEIQSKYLMREGCGGFCRKWP